MGGNPKLGPTFSHDILQYWDEHSQLFTLNSQHEISNLGQKNPKLGPTFSHDILQYWDKHSQLFMLNSQHEICLRPDVSYFLCCTRKRDVQQRK